MVAGTQEESCTRRSSAVCSARVQEILQSLHAQNIRDFMRITDSSRDAVRQHAAVELRRSDQRALAVHMTVDKAGHGEPALGIDLLHAAVAVEGAHDGAAAHGDVARLQFAGDQVQDAGVAYHQVGGQPAQSLIDLPFQYLSHAQSPMWAIRERDPRCAIPYYRVSFPGPGFHGVCRRAATIDGAQGMEVLRRSAQGGSRSGRCLVDGAAAARHPAGGVRHRHGRARRRRAARPCARSDRSPLPAPIFVLLQVLSPIHQAVSANLGDRTAAWLYDRLTEACVRPPGMGHLEDPTLTSDLTVARDFDLGMTGPPLSISMDFIASGMVEMIGGIASRRDPRALRLVGAAACSPAPGWPRIGCCARAPSGATATPRKCAPRSAMPTTPTAWPSIRPPARNCGCSAWPAGPSTASSPGAPACTSCSTRPPACASAR